MSDGYEEDEFLLKAPLKRPLKEKVFKRRPTPLEHDLIQSSYRWRKKRFPPLTPPRGRGALEGHEAVVEAAVVEEAVVEEAVEPPPGPPEPPPGPPEPQTRLPGPPFGWYW